MKTISFYNAKGGTGKTSLCYLSGLYLSSIGKRVLFIDLDSQCSLTRYLEIDETPGYNLFDILINSADIHSSIRETKDFNYIPGNLKTQKLFSGIPENKFKKLLNNLSYEYVLLDCPPALSSIVYSAIHASSTIILPFIASKADIESTLFASSEARELKEKVELITVFNRYKDTMKDNYYIEMLEELDGLTTTFPNISNLSLFIEGKDDLNLKRNILIKQSIEKILKLIGVQVIVK